MLPTPPALDSLLAALTKPAALIELGVLATVLAVTAVLVYVMRSVARSVRAEAGRTAPLASIWFGDYLVDGVLFPSLALALAYLARQVLFLQGWPLAVFKLAIPVLLSLALIRLSVRVLTVAFPHSLFMRVAERTISWLAWGALVLWLTGVLPAFMDGLDEISWKLGAKPVTLRTLIEGTLSAGFVLMLALWVSAALEARLLDGVQGGQLSLRKAAANALRAFLMFVGLLVALSAVGIDLTALGVLGGALGVGIGFGLQKLAANYVSGFVILAERSLRIGDLVQVADFEGRITDITTRYTVIRAGNGREAIVPNETLITTTVQNLSLGDSRLLLTTRVSVAYGTDVAALCERICTTVGSIGRVLPDPAPTAHFVAFGADGLDLKITFWIADPDQGQGNVLSEVNLAILALLDRDGIEIPYPQRVLRILRETPAAAPRLAAGSNEALTDTNASG
ncbi:MscS Mechanosensitive ion channel [Leptothrix cholodnii SP-6]|uniref:MscS Mechanosensitive ion channel n=1 Tax=Leptothrix cholodnii (strain ATCC 51168 / LMG 8142 / SP-6) TaxID=395495 RepID=B1Y045_LEPCP|nr:mechanosensitive ion channel domain-containing protein [Leptothrix cholodnii]ACB35326.1 MscS Mechanosensitive ion channel [Leptothrix cholodnii SP-6]